MTFSSTICKHYLYKLGLSWAHSDMTVALHQCAIKHWAWTIICLAWVMLADIYPDVLFHRDLSFVIWSVLFSSYSWWRYAYIKQKWGKGKNLDVEKTWHIFNHVWNAWNIWSIKSCISCWPLTFLAKCNMFHLIRSFSELRKITFRPVQNERPFYIFLLCWLLTGGLEEQ